MLLQELLVFENSLIAHLYQLLSRKIGSIKLFLGIERLLPCHCFEKLAYLFVVLSDVRLIKRHSCLLLLFL